MAVDLVGRASDSGNNSTSAATDVTGAVVSPEDVKRIEDSLKNL